MALYNIGDDNLWGNTEVVVFDAKTGKKLKQIDLNWEDSVVNLEWKDEKLIIDYDRLIDYPASLNLQ